MQVQTSQFSGPLDLLLQLIRREEMDIFDIDIHKITEQYLSSLSAGFPDLDSAGDFIRMAALLIYIKSKNLFPVEVSSETEEPEPEDLKKALEQSLIKMRVVQDTAKKLYQTLLLNRDVWSRGGGSFASFLPNVSREVLIKKQAPLPLLRAYRRVFEHRKKARAFSSPTPMLSLTECLRHLRHRLSLGQAIKMSALTGLNSPWPKTLVTFLALLELSRLGVVSLTQEKEYSDIAILVQKQFNDKSLELVQEI